MKSLLNHMKESMFQIIPNNGSCIHFIHVGRESQGRLGRYLKYSESVNLKKPGSYQIGIGFITRENLKYASTAIKNSNVLRAKHLPLIIFSSFFRNMFIYLELIHRHYMKKPFLSTWVFTFCLNEKNILNEKRLDFQASFHFCMCISSNDSRNKNHYVYLNSSSMISLAIFSCESLSSFENTTALIFGMSISSIFSLKVTCQFLLNLRNICSASLYDSS